MVDGGSSRQQDDEEAETNSAGDEAARSKGLSWLKDNSSVIFGVASVAFVAVRLLGIARGDPETAYAILQATGTGNALVGSLVSTVGLLALPICATLGFYAWRSRGSASFFPLLIGSSAVFIVAIYMAPIFTLLSTVVSTIVVIPLSRRFMSALRRHARDASSLLFIGIAAYLFLIFVYEIIIPTPWLPEQAISVAGHKPFSGYVLSVTNGGTTILTFHPEGVENVPSKDILTAAECTPSGYLENQATLIGLLESSLSAVTDYPPCPSTPYR
jgi:hypothetical protein